MPQVEQLTPPDVESGETPVWLPSHGGLVWTDQAAGDLLRLDGSGDVERWHVGARVALARPRLDGGLVLALDRSFARADAWGGALDHGAELWSDPDIWFNDGGCDPTGALWAGSAPADYAGTRCALLRHTPDGVTTRVVEAVGLSNGIAWSPDGSLAYWTDTLTGRIDVFDNAPDATGGRPFATIEDGAGYPDGLTVDAAGRVWVALWNGGAVRCYEPDGTLAEIVEVPVRQVTACCFGGPDLSELYVTTKREGHTPDETTTAGAVFRIVTGATGMPVAPFGG